MTGKIAHALKQKFGTPERMMAALGLDQALLKELRPRRRLATDAYPEMERGEPKPGQVFDDENAEARLNIGRRLADKGLSAEAVDEVLKLMFPEATDEIDEAAAQRRLEMHGSSDPVVDTIPSNAINRGFGGHLSEGHRDVAAAMDAMRRIGTGMSSTREAPRLAMDRTARADAELSKMFPGIEKIGIQ